MHAGTPVLGPASSPKGWRGRGLRVWRHGNSAETRAEQKRARELLIQSRELLKQIQATACYLVRELQAMAIISGRLGKKSDKGMYEQHARQLSALINKVFG